MFTSQLQFGVRAEQRSVTQKQENTLPNQTFFSFIKFSSALSSFYHVIIRHITSKFKTHVSEINRKKCLPPFCQKSIFPLGCNCWRFGVVSTVSDLLEAWVWLLKRARPRLQYTRRPLLSARPFLSTPFSAFVHHHQYCLGKKVGPARPTRTTTTSWGGTTEHQNYYWEHPPCPLAQ